MLVAGRKSDDLPLLNPQGWKYWQTSVSFQKPHSDPTRILLDKVVPWNISIWSMVYLHIYLFFYSYPMLWSCFCKGHSPSSSKAATWLRISSNSSDLMSLGYLPYFPVKMNVREVGRKHIIFCVKRGDIHIFASILLYHRFAHEQEFSSMDRLDMNSASLYHS